MFGYSLWVGFFGDGGYNGAIFDSNKFKMAAAAILDNFEMAIIIIISDSNGLQQQALTSL